MQSFLFLCTVALLGVTSTNAAGCSFPGTMEGEMGFYGQVVFNGYTTPQEGFGTFAYSANMKRMANSFQITTGATAQTFKQILDFSDMSKVIQYRINKTGCFATPPDVPVMMGIPDNAEKVSSYYFGMDTKLGATTYKFTINGTEFVTAITGDCVPIIQIQRMKLQVGQTSVDLFQTLGFVNMTKTITDPSVFVIPPECRKPRH